MTVLYRIVRLDLDRRVLASRYVLAVAKPSAPESLRTTTLRLVRHHVGLAQSDPCGDAAALDAHRSPRSCSATTRLRRGSSLAKVIGLQRLELICHA